MCSKLRDNFKQYFSCFFNIFVYGGFRFYVRGKMQGERGSVFKSFFLNPLVWIGIVLMLFTIHYEGSKVAFSVFFKVETYRNLAIGTALYVGLFDKKYTKGMERLDISETLLTVVYDMVMVLLVWIVSLALVVNYQLGGENYSAALTERYRKNGWMTEDKTPANVNEVLKKMDVEAGKRYKVTPHADGSFTVEVEEE